MVPICSKNGIMNSGTARVCSCTLSKPRRNIDDRKNYIQII